MNKAFGSLIIAIFVLITAHSEQIDSERAESLTQNEAQSHAPNNPSPNAQPSGDNSSTELSDLFKISFDSYVKKAKELSRKQMTKEEISTLAEKAYSIISNIKTKCIEDKLGVQRVDLKYGDGSDFPDLSKHKNTEECDKRIVELTIACYRLDKILTKDLVYKIVEKSPLEMVSVMRELAVFYQFVSANPEDFGHGFFREKNEDNSVTVYATNDAILRIMKVLVYRNFLRHNKLYKVSRITSKFFNETETGQLAEPLEVFISSLKRSTADDSRKTIYILGSMLEDNENESTNEFQATRKNFINALNLSRKSSESSETREQKEKATKFAKALLGLVSDVKISTSAKVDEFCKMLAREREEKSKMIDLGGAQNLRIIRDVNNYEQIEKFLKTMSKIFDTLYNDREIIDLILEKIPDFVPELGQEITVFLRVLEMIIAPKINIGKVVAKMREFATYPPDGSYIMTPLVSELMGKFPKSEVKTTLKNTDFSKLDICKYLHIR